MSECADEDAKPLPAGQNPPWQPPEVIPPEVISVSKGDEIIGYMVQHPNGPEKKFINRKKPMMQKLKRAMKYWENLNSMECPLADKQIKLEKYVKKHKNGFAVKYPGEKKLYFGNRMLSLDERYALALEYLNTLRVKHGEPPVDIPNCPMFDGQSAAKAYVAPWRQGPSSTTRRGQTETRDAECQTDISWLDALTVQDRV